MIEHQAVRYYFNQFGYKVLANLLDKESPISWIKKDWLMIDTKIVKVIIMTGAKLNIAHNGSQWQETEF